MRTRRIVQRNRRPAERAIIFAALMGGLTLEETRKLLAEAGYSDRSLPERSWVLLNEAYLPKFRENHRFMGESIFTPKAMGDLADI
jgi:hypothetical protein